MFWFRLAKKLGMSVKRCQQEINSAEFAEWMVMDKREPFTFDRVEYAIATLTALTANINSSGKRYKSTDFLPFGKSRERDAKVIEKNLGLFYGSNK